MAINTASRRSPSGGLRPVLTAAARVAFSKCKAGTEKRRSAEQRNSPLPLSLGGAAGSAHRLARLEIERCLGGMDGFPIDLEVFHGQPRIGRHGIGNDMAMAMPDRTLQAEQADWLVGG
jgi:hypothetical protein